MGAIQTFRKTNDREVTIDHKIPRFRKMTSVSFLVSWGSEVFESIQNEKFRKLEIQK